MNATTPKAYTTAATSGIILALDPAKDKHRRTTAARLDGRPVGLQRHQAVPP